MTDGRASLGARIAEAMGWSSSPSGKLYAPPNDDEALWSAEELLSWEGYGVVDAWMREQGWLKGVVATDAKQRVVYWHKPKENLAGEASGDDEPLAAIQAALKALEACE